MKPFSLSIKPASADCNLRCEYCFYIDHIKNGSDNPRMTVETLQYHINLKLMNKGFILQYANF